MSIHGRLALGTLALLALTASGCYERVVEARGLGTSGIENQKPEQSFLDRVLGPKPTTIDSRPRIRVN